MVRRVGSVSAVLVAVLVAAWACSNDVELPARYHEGHLAQPSDVQTAVDAGTITVSWSMSSETNVSGYVVGFTDLSGTEHTRSVEEQSARTHTEDKLDVTPGTVYLVQVWAFDATQFFGPRSDADTLVVKE